VKLTIIKSENGYHVIDADNGESCFETKEHLTAYLCGFLPKKTGDSIILKAKD